MRPDARRPLAAIAVAIGVTTAMDAAGLFTWSALPLLPLAAGLWLRTREPRAEIGLTLGRPRDFGVALLTPLAVTGMAVLLAFAAGGIGAQSPDWRKVGLDVAVVALSSFVGSLLTEEGFFRGWLWAALRRSGRDDRSVLIWTSVSFSLWHVSAVTLDTGFRLPAGQVPTYLASAALLGACWGAMRLASGSVVVASLGHGVWNGLAYVLFGFGERTGALGVADTALLGVEVGLAGLALHAVSAAVLWRWARRQRARGGPAGADRQVSTAGP